MENIDQFVDIWLTNPVLVFVGYIACVEAITCRVCGIFTENV